MSRLSHVTKTEDDWQRPLSADDVGLIVATFLNGYVAKNPNRPTNRERARIDAVTELVRCLQKLQSLAIYGEDRDKAEFAKTRNWIRRYLERYRGMPVFSEEVNLFPWEWPIRWAVEPSLEAEAEYSEYVFNLLSGGFISDLKECARCSNWLFARFSHQRFCSEDCRERFHQTNEADKKRRADWARENYRKRKKRSHWYNNSLDGR